MRIYGPTHSERPTASGRDSAFLIISVLKLPPLVSISGEKGTWLGEIK